MLTVYKAFTFALASGGIAWLSRASLRDVHSHGFYRFFAWEAILLLFLINVDYWFVAPFSLRQIVAWTFLILSLLFIYHGVQLFRKQGEVDGARQDPALLRIEKTTQLVTTGLYGYIRHPFYSSLLFLGWGIGLKHISWISITLAAVITLLLVITARKEEKENVLYFGEPYRDYMTRTKTFIPFIF